MPAWRRRAGTPASLRKSSSNRRGIAGSRAGEGYSVGTCVSSSCTMASVLTSSASPFEVQENPVAQRRQRHSPHVVDGDVGVSAIERVDLRREHDRLRRARAGAVPRELASPAEWHRVRSDASPASGGSRRPAPAGDRNRARDLAHLENLRAVHAPALTGALDHAWSARGSRASPLRSGSVTFSLKKKRSSCASGSG